MMSNDLVKRRGSDEVEELFLTTRRITMLLISSTLRRSMAILLCLFSWAQTGVGLASSFEVSPIRVTFSPKSQPR